MLTSSLSDGPGPTAGADLIYWMQWTINIRASSKCLVIATSYVVLFRWILVCIFTSFNEEMEYLLPALTPCRLQYSLSIT